VVACNIDPSSDLARKNPAAIVEAFLAAKRRAPSLHLVAKLMLPRDGSGAPALEWMRGLAAADASIHLVEAPLSDADLLSLFASCDAYISMHRAEGLGLGMLQAMHLGLPVVATAYSGNMSFMDEDSACLVPYETVPVRDTKLPTYQAVAHLAPTWAEPDVEAAADWLVTLATDREFRRQRAHAAARAAAAWQREALAFDWLDRLAEIARARKEKARAARPVFQGFSFSWKQ
jgi:glycosyltransferase involved in cell wall biosynthesis